MAFVASVLPQLEELHDEHIAVISACVVAGYKFYTNDLLHSSADVQATNYDYMRYYQELQSLINLYPHIAQATKTKRILKWL